MKKLVTVLALCAAVSAYAQVESQNIVGYNTLTIEKQWTIVAFNFEATGGGEASIQQAFPYATGMTKSNSTSFADNIQIQNAGGGYDIYYMSNGLDAKGSTVVGLDGKWAAFATYTPTTNKIKSGTAAWYKTVSGTPASFSIITAGQVLTTATGDLPVTLATKHIANPYAADLYLNNGIPYVTGMTKSNSTSFADNIQIQNAGGGYDIYYMSNGLDAKGSTVSGLDGKWAAFATYVPTTTGKIPAGKGAWYMRRGASDFTIQTVRPFNL